MLISTMAFACNTKDEFDNQHCLTSDLVVVPVMAWVLQKNYVWSITFVIENQCFYNFSAMIIIQKVEIDNRLCSTFDLAAVTLNTWDLYMLACELVFIASRASNEFYEKEGIVTPLTLCIYICNLQILCKLVR